MSDVKKLQDRWSELTAERSACESEIRKIDNELVKIEEQLDELGAEYCAY